MSAEPEFISGGPDNVAPIPERSGKSKRGRKPGSQPKQRPEIPDEEFETFGYTPATERVSHKRRREPISEKQAAINQTIGENYDDWLKAGSPANWADMPVIHWTVSRSFEETADFMLKKAIQAHGRKFAWGERVYTDDKVTIYFCVIAKPPRRSNTTEE